MYSTLFFLSFVGDDASNDICLVTRLCFVRINRMSLILIVTPMNMYISTSPFHSFVNTIPFHFSLCLLFFVPNVSG